MSFVPLNDAPDPSRPRTTTAFAKVKKDERFAPVTTELVRQASGTFVIRQLDDLSHLDDRYQVSEANRWMSERKVKRAAAEDFGIEAVNPDDEEWQPMVQEWTRQESCVDQLNALVASTSFLVVIFIRNFTDPSSRAYLDSIANHSLLKSVQKKGGQVVVFTSKPFDASAVMEAKFGFPLIRESSCTLARRYRLYITKDGNHLEGCVVLKRNEDTSKMLPDGTFRWYNEILYHWHSTPRSQTDEEADRGDIPEALYQQRVPEPFVLAITYGMGSQIFRKIEEKLSQRELTRAQASEAGRGRHQNYKRVNKRRNRFFDEYDPDMDEFLASNWEGCGPHCEICVANGDSDAVYKYLAKMPQPDSIWKLLVGIFATREKAEHLEKHLAQLTASATKRLGRDWRQLVRDPIPGIRAHPPYDNDIFEWHCDLVGPESDSTYAGVKYHMIMEFPRDYPLSPPTIRFRGSIYHPNIFGSYICLNMLTDFARDASEAVELYSGWTSAYTVQSILLQLSAFIFDGARHYRKILTHDKFGNPIDDYPNKKRDEMWNEYIRSSIASTRAFKCPCRKVEAENVYIKTIQDQPVPEPEESKQAIADEAYSTSSSSSATSSASDQKKKGDEDDDWELVNMGLGSASTKALSLNQLTPSPITSTLSSFNIFATDNSVYTKSFWGKVVKLESFGALIDIGLSQKKLALCHVSQIDYEFTNHPKDKINIGDIVICRILNIDPVLRRVSVSCKGRFGPVVDTLPHTPLWNATVKGFNPEGGLIVSCFDGNRTYEGVVPNDAYLTLAFSPRHFWHPKEVIAIGTPITVRLIHMQMPERKLVLRLIPEKIKMKKINTAHGVNAQGLDALAQAVVNASKNVKKQEQFFLSPQSKRFLLNSLQCFHSKISFRHDVLGLGLNVEHYESGEISWIHAQFDLISQTAFEQDGVRRGVSRAPFTHFLPLYFDQQHAGDLSVHEKYVAALCKNKVRDRADEIVSFHPLMVLKVLPSLLNTMIVSMMKGNMHESIAALSGYLSIYHLMLAFTLKYPEIRASATKRLGAFMDNENGRSKKSCPNLGELLALLSVSDVAWMDIAKVLIQEVFDRNVKWCIKAHPELRIAMTEEQMDAAALAREEAKKKKANDPAAKQVSKEEAERIKQRRKIILSYQSTGKSSAVQKAEAEAAKAAAEARAQAEANKIEAAKKSAAVAPVATPEGDEESKQSEEGDGGFSDVDHDDCEYPSEEEEENVQEVAVKRGGHGANSDEEEEEEEEEEDDEEVKVPLTKAEQLRLQYLNDLDRGRLPKSFRAGRVSYRLVLFHVHFLAHFRGLTRENLTPIHEVKRQLDATFGRAAVEQEVTWQRSVKELKRVNNWKAFFGKLGLSVPADDFLLAWLRASVGNSLRRRYHSNRPPPLSPEEQARRDAIRKKREFAARLAEDGDFANPDQVDFGDARL